MPKVSIELDTLKSWFSRLENNESYAVTEEIFDEIQRIEKELKDSNKELAQMKRERKMSAIETPLTFNQIQMGQQYRFLSSVSFKGSKHKDLAGAEVTVFSKGRTKITVQIIEPGKMTTGELITTHPHFLTKI